MKICIYGAGAMGGYIGALLARTGAGVTLIARGPQLEAIRRDGLRLIIGGEELVMRPFATDDPAAAGPQDYVLVTLKAHSLPAVAARMRPLFHGGTALVTAMNGVPWWYFYKHPAPYGGRRVESVDPGGGIWDAIGPERAIGCVLWQACEVVAPGVIRHQQGNRMPIGEPDGAASARCEALARLLVQAGFDCPVLPDIRTELWMKLWGNLSFNPVSVLTTATLDTIARDPGTQMVVGRMMEESRAIGEKLGIRFGLSIADRIRTAERVGAHKTSMLQDLEAGRPMEIEALVGSVAELGRLVGVPTPAIDIVYALVVQRARVAGLYATETRTERA